MIKIKKFEEAFTAGSASTVVQKLGVVLSKKIGEPISFASVPLLYQNAYGSFAGYLGSVSKGRLFLKINFKLTSSEAISSIDFYESDVSVPEYTIETTGLNIIQIVDLIIGEFIEDGELDDSLMESASKVKPFLKERGRPTKNPEEFVKVINRWVEEDSRVLNDLQNKSLADIYSNQYLKWASDKPAYKEIKYGLFAKVVKFFLLERGLTNKTFRKRKKGSKERAVEDPIMEAQIEELVSTISWEEKFEFLRGSIAQMYANKIQSIFIYGDPGSGKTHEVTKTLDKMNADYELYTGGVKTTDDLIRLLYVNREDKIIVLDDLDAIKKSSANILKAALQNQVSRTITYVNRSKATSEIPSQFEFTSGIIFISNDPNPDPAIASRSINIEISLSNEEMINKIETSLKEFMPEVDLKTKQEALDYAREISPGVKTIDFRVLNSIIVAMQISANWRKMSLLMIQSMG